MPRKLSGFERMWNAYPAPGGTADEAKAMIGGDAAGNWLTNTCVIRVSRALNYAGHPLPQGFPGLSTVRGADGMRYAFRVEELRKYLTHVHGPPDFAVERASPAADPPEPICGKYGIIVFQVRGWLDATGHVDLWDGAECRHKSYFERSHRILFWRVASCGDTRIAPGTTVVPLTASVGRGAPNRPDDVARVQALLDARGLEVGPADGVMTQAVSDAISTFQKRFLAAADGRVDPDGRTWRELNGL